MSESFEHVDAVVARWQRERYRDNCTDIPGPPPRDQHAALRERQARYRERRRNGEVVVTISLSETEVDRLHRQRCLDLDKLEDRGAIAAAIHLLLASIVDP